MASSTTKSGSPPMDGRLREDLQLGSGTKTSGKGRMRGAEGAAKVMMEDKGGEGEGFDDLQSLVNMDDCLLHRILVDLEAFADKKIDSFRMRWRHSSMRAGAGDVEWTTGAERRLCNIIVGRCATRRGWRGFASTDHKLFTNDALSAGEQCRGPGAVAGNTRPLSAPCKEHPERPPSKAHGDPTVRRSPRNRVVSSAGDGTCVTGGDTQEPQPCAIALAEKCITPTPKGWRATITVGGDQRELGCFSIYKDAAYVYNHAAKHFYGPSVACIPMQEGYIPEELTEQVKEPEEFLVSQYPRSAYNKHEDTSRSTLRRRDKKAEGEYHPRMVGDDYQVSVLPAAVQTVAARTGGVEGPSPPRDSSESETSATRSDDHAFVCSRPGSKRSRRTGSLSAAPVTVKPRKCFAAADCVNTNYVWPAPDEVSWGPDIEPPGADLIWDPRGCAAVGDETLEDATAANAQKLLDLFAPANQEKALEVLQKHRHDVSLAVQELTEQHGLRILQPPLSVSAAPRSAATTDTAASASGRVGAHGALERKADRGDSRDSDDSGDRFDRKSQQSMVAPPSPSGAPCETLANCSRGQERGRPKRSQNG